MVVDSISGPLLKWYDAHARVLPWRHPPGSSLRPSPYRVWLAEIMLQQTTVVTAAPHYTRFLELWPTVADLAAADDAEVMHAWAGLGYYARARSLLAAARQIVARGGFPETEAGLRSLPGVGPYTAAAVAAIAFGERATVVDTNVERVTARLFAIAEPLPGARATIAARLAPHVPADRPGDFAQAMMDLGATVCRVRNPGCLLCPLAAYCTAALSQAAEAFPVKQPRKPRPHRHGIAWWIEHGSEVALVRRPARGLLGGMLALPGPAWGPDGEHRYPLAGNWTLLPQPVRHGFTHFELSLAIARTVVERRIADIAGSAVIWTPREDVLRSGLPTLYARAAEAALFSNEQAAEAALFSNERAAEAALAPPKEMEPAP